MIPFRFGAADRQLYAVLHAPHPAQASLGVVLCNPFGQEAIRTHRLYRVLADRLARAGVACMRFDYFGTGESDGDDLDGDLSVWCVNIQEAQQELLRRVPCQRVAWMGARLGATLASLASAQVKRPPDALLLWEPIIDGVRYLGELEQATAATLTRLPPLPGEALGIAMSDRLQAQIRQLQETELLQAATQRLTVLADQHDTARQQLCQRYGHPGASSEFVPLQVPFDWTAEEAMNTSLVPPAALQMLTQQLEQCRA